MLDSMPIPISVKQALQKSPIFKTGRQALRFVPQGIELLVLLTTTDVSKNNSTQMKSQSSFILGLGIHFCHEAFGYES